MAAGGEVTSAATLVCSLLEHQGYLAQAQFLDIFESFFRDAGALLMLLSGIGGVLSLLLYGSFRAPVYLIIGPALFWFLVGPRAENVEGVVWQLGGGAERGMRGVEGAAQTTRQNILEQLDQAGVGPNASPAVAKGFWLFVKPINEFTNEMSDFLLRDEDRSDLLVASRVYGLEIVSTAMPHDTESIQRIEQGLMTGCQNMMAAAHAAASLIVRNQNPGGGGAAPQANQAFTQALNVHMQRVREYSTSEQVDTRVTGFDTLIQGHANRQGGSELARSLLWNNGQVRPHITCRDAWALVAEETWHRAALDLPRALRIGSAGLAIPQLRERACADITRVAVSRTGDQNANLGNCNLQPAVALAVINQRLAQPAVYNRVQSRHWNDSPHRNPAPHALLTTGALGRTFTTIATTGATLFQTAIDSLNRSSISVFLRSDQAAGNGQIQRTSLWAPVMEMNQDYGMDHTMWVLTRQHEIVRLRQQVFSYALHLPYYQGMLLYILSVAYPFFALIVIVPGKAASFLYLPLAWLWVKSWDIGFAVVIILDKVLFNLLPSREMAEPLRTGPWTDINLLPRVLAEAYNFDPLGSIHSYYSILSFVWLSIPVVTGYLTLRAKSSVLASFTEGAGSAAAESGEAAASGYSIAQQSKRAALMKEMQGFATKLPTLGKNGIGSGKAGVVAKVLASMAAGSKTAKDVDWGKVLQGDVTQAHKLGDAGVAYLNTYARTALKESRLESSLLRAWDPVLGRWSNMGLAASIAALDGRRGYELYDHDLNVTDELIDALGNRLETTMQAVGNMEGAVVKNVIGGAGNLDLTKKGLIKGGLTGGGILLGGATAYANLNNTSLKQIKNAAGGEAYSMEQFKTFMMNDHPALPFQHGFNDAAYARQGLFESIFGVMNPYPAAGGINSPTQTGSSAYLNALLASSGGDREGPYLVKNGKEFPPPPLKGSLTTDAMKAFEHVAKLPSYLEGSAFQGFFAPPQLFALDLQRDAHFQREDLPLYQREVQERMDALIEAYGGRANIAKHFDLKKSQPLTVEHLYDYTEHLLESRKEELKKKGELLNVYLPPLDERYEKAAKSNPLAVLDQLHEWNRHCGTSYFGTQIKMRQAPGPIVTEPSKRWK